MFKIERHTDFIAHHPCIMPWLHFESFPRAHFDFIAVGASNSYMAGDNVSDMSLGNFAGDAAYMSRPSPAWTIFPSADSNRS